MAAVQSIGCSAPTAQIHLSNLQVSPSTVEVGEQVTISLDIRNAGNVEGSYVVNCSLDNGLESFVQQVTLAPDEARTLTFNRTPIYVGQYTISVGGLSQVFSVTATVEGMWRIPYRVVDGEITMDVAIAGMTPVIRTVEFPPTTFTMYVSKEMTNGSRQVVIDHDSFISEPVIIENIIRGIDMELLFTLREDATGQLYVGNGAGDVDVFSVDYDGSIETQFGDGIKDSLGSELMFSPSEGQSVTLGQTYIVPMEVYSTTGNSSNTVIAVDRNINGSTLECRGMPFAENGKMAPYVGTGATIVSTGSSLDRSFSGFRVDFQFMTVMEIEPVE